MGAPRARAKGLDLAPDGAAALVETLGEEPGALEQALDQLGVDVPRRARHGAELVARQFRGLGEQHVWDLCDRAFAKDLPGRDAFAADVARRAGARGCWSSGGSPRGCATSSASDRSRADAARRRPRSRPAYGSTGRCAATGNRPSGSRCEELVALHERVAWADRALKSGATDDVVLPLVVSAIAGEPAASTR